MINALFEFVTMAFPKAGIQVGGLPLTLNMLLFGLILLINFRTLPAYIQSIPNLFIPYYFLFCFSILSLMVNYSQKTVSSMEIAMTIVVIMSPLAGVAIYNLNIEHSFKIMNISTIIVGGYMIIQKVFGIINTSVIGITYTLGQDLTKKNIGYTMAVEGSEANKMPSTYQNGNSSGLFLASSLFLLLLWNPVKKKWKALKYIGIICSSIGLLLSGSRSILFPLLILLIFILYSYLKNLTFRKKRNVILVFILFVIILFFYFLTIGNQLYLQLYDRFFIQTVNNPTSNRGTMWINAINYIYFLNGSSLVRFLLIGVPNNAIGSDGMMGFLLSRGVIAQISFIICLLIPIVDLHRKKTVKVMSWILFSIFIAFMIDMSFFYLPCLMNYYFAYMIIKNKNICDEIKEANKLAN